MPAKKTPLYNQHVSLGGKMVEFAGFLMPVQYSGIIDEHNAVRNSCGIFDVSHMGEIEFTGPQAKKAIQHLTTNDISNMKPGDINIPSCAMNRAAWWTTFWFTCATRRNTYWW